MLRRWFSISPARLRRVLRGVGLAILVLGLSAAAGVWQTAPRNGSVPDDNALADPSAPLAISDSGKQSRDVELYYGKTGLLMERWSEMTKTLSHGKPLAKTLVVISSVAALACFLAAARLPLGGE